MSDETTEWLNRNVLIGFTDQRGKAWHYRKSDQGVEPNHYDGPIPLGDVQRRLFAWKPQEAEVQARLDTPEGQRIFLDDRRKAIIRPDTGRVLGIVSQSYTIHSYRTWLLDNVSTLLGQSSGYRVRGSP